MIELKQETPRQAFLALCAQHCADGQFGQQPAAQLPWFHTESAAELAGDTATGNDLP